MNCPDWELDSPEFAEHVKVCEECRELEKNAAALRELTIPPAAYTGVRARVLGEIQAKRRRAKWWILAPAAAAACAVLVVLWSVAQPIAPPAPIVAKKDPPNIEWTPRAIQNTSSGPRLAKARRAQKTEQIVAVKMLTDDPNVIIIWLVDQKGDSL